MGISNPITKFRLDYLRPLPLVVDFDWSDVAGGSVSMGLCRAGHLINKTTVEIIEAFNGGLGITIGDSVAQGRLQAVADNVPEEVSHYEVVNNYEYVSETAIFLFFPNGTPTVGRGRAIVYFD
jgi:hypothetical protein